MASSNQSTILLTVLLILALGLYGGCRKNHDVCGAESGMVLDEGSCIAWEDDGLLDGQRETIAGVIREALSLVNQVMPINNIRIRVRSDPSNAIPEIGIGGYNPGPDEVILYFDPSFPEIEKSMDTELGPLLAHELHHARRRRAVGYGSTLLEACVSEGLADWFSMEIAGIPPPPWSVALTGPELDQFIQLASLSWTETGYDHSTWFYGATNDIPRWTGYSIGYELVKNYLAKHPTRKASNLFGEPANSFKP